MPYDNSGGGYNTGGGSIAGGPVQAPYGDPNGGYGAGRSDPGQRGASGFGGLAQGLGIASSYQANAPNQAGYTNVENTAYGNQQQYNGMAQAAQGRGAPTITNPFQAASQGQIAGAQGNINAAIGAAQNLYQNPQDSQAAAALRSGTDQGINAAMAMANSARGGAFAQAGARRAAQEQNAQSQAALTSQAAQIAAANQLGEINTAGNLAQGSGNLGLGQYSLEQQNAQQQANLAEQTARGNDAYSVGLINAANNAGQQQVNALNGSTQGDIGAQQINAGTAQQSASAGKDLFGGLMSAGGKALGAALSDPKVKTDMRNAGEHRVRDAGERDDPTPREAAGGAETSAATQQRLGGRDARQQEVWANYAAVNAAHRGEIGGANGASLRFLSDPRVKTDMQGAGYSAAASGPSGGPAAAIDEDDAKFFSDPKNKSGMRGGEPIVDAFLSHMGAKTFRYKEARHEPTDAPTGGTYLGVNANDVESAPVVGRQIVKHGPEGKMIDTRPALSAALAGLGRLHERVRRLEHGGSAMERVRRGHEVSGGK